MSVLQAEVRCEQPNASLYTFTGNLMLAPPFAQHEQTVPLSQASLLLRGSSLRNTKYVFGAVIFAGHQSKVDSALSIGVGVITGHAVAQLTAVQLLSCHCSCCLATAEHPVIVSMCFLTRASTSCSAQLIQ